MSWKILLALLLAVAFNDDALASLDNGSIRHHASLSAPDATTSAIGDADALETMASQLEKLENPEIGD